MNKPWLASFPRRFVAAGLSVEKWEDIAPYYEQLGSRPVDTKNELEGWLIDLSELKSVAEEFVTRRYIAMTCQTDDTARKDAYLYCVREVDPKMTEWDDKLLRKYLQSPARGELDMGYFARLDRMFRVTVELFDERNIPVQVKLSELSQSYQEIMGAMTVVFDGKELTLQQAAAYLREPDRDVRRRAFLSAVERRMRDREKLDALFDEMLNLRSQYAENLNLPTYMEYCFKSKLRDYTPEDCLAFHDAIEKRAVPLAREINKRRAEEMGLDAVKPWDAVCDPKSRPPLRPFEKAEELFNGVTSVFKGVDMRLGDMFGSIGFSMDLDSRKGKAPGGYQATLEEARVPFIFTNAVGLQDDVNTLLHEGGHAFHTLQSRINQHVWYRHAPMEFSEVASMSMELAGGDFLSPFYQAGEEKARAKRERLESVVTLFPWVAQVDAFQRWIYTHPGHTPRDRDRAWLALTDRFSTGVDWTGTPEGALESSWHRQLHIFEVPFYYIEYAIAQMGALQIYRRFKSDPKAAVEGYLSALSLGGGKPVDELFSSAGIKFDFSDRLLGELMEFTKKEMGL
jgi:oligoendopeptidase F